jgi:triosephosphate isomerase
MSRKYLIAGNWKMNPAPLVLRRDMPHSPYHPRPDVDVVVFPTFLDLQSCIDAKILCGPQFGHTEEHGAHTGDISLKMCKNLGCLYTLCGHSERRADHGETSEDVAAQAIAALELQMHPVVCVGETEEERDAGKEKEVVQAQIAVLPLESDITIAYEPVWAIGTGKTASPEQAQEMHAYIRSLLPEDRQEQTRILYGGSMKPNNAQELLSQSDIDGGLIGGASLQSDQFGEIVEIASKLSE